MGVLKCFPFSLAIYLLLNYHHLSIHNVSQRDFEINILHLISYNIDKAEFDSVVDKTC